MRATAHNLAATVPFSLGRVKIESPESGPGEPTITINENEEIRPAFALLLVWPLSMASSLDDVASGLKVWLQQQLVYIGRVLGDGALDCAGTDQWAHDMRLTDS